MGRQPLHSCRTLSVRQMQRLDEAAIRAIGIPRLLLMDAAGRAVAQVVRELIPAPAQDLLVCCGLGYNGGDGLCAAWYLTRWGYQPHLIITGERAHLKDEPAVYARILEGLGQSLHELTGLERVEALREPMSRAPLIVDALLGIGWQGPLRPLQERLIRLMNQSGKPIVAVDVPSGLDADTGLPNPVAVKAAMTVTFGWPKQGLLLGEGPAHAGRLQVEDIGMPASLLSGLG